MIYSGADWPPDSARINDYRRYLALYDGDHRDAFREKVAAQIYAGDALTFLVCNYPRTIVNIPADLLVGAPPVISYEEKDLNDAWQQIQQDSHFDTALLEAVQDSRKLGDAVFVARRSGQQVLIETKPAYCFFPELDPDNVRVSQSQRLAWRRPFEGKDIVRVDRYEPGQVVREAWTLDGIKVGRRMIGAELARALGAAPEVETTGVADRSTLVHLPNGRSSKDFFGRSELGGGMEALFEEVDERLSQISRILDKHADPKMSGPPLAAGPGQVVNLSQANYFPAVQGLETKYITWDAQLIAAFESYKHVVEEIWKHSQISPLLAGYVNGASYDSSRAFKLQMAATLLMMARAGLYLDAATRDVVRVALALKLGIPFADVPAPNIRWRDGLPKDLAELAQTNSTRIATGTLSRHTAIMAELDCDEATAAAELAKAEAEKAAPVDGSSGATEIKAKADAFGALVRSGADPDSAATLANLDGLKSTRIPTTVRPAEAEASGFEQV